MIAALDCPLEGTHFIEASAGSGKTWTLSALVLRLIESGAPPKRIVATTFTNDAAFELKTRIYERIAGYVAYLKKIQLGNPHGDSDDPVYVHLGAQAQQDNSLHSSIYRAEQALAQCDQMYVGTLDGLIAKMSLKMGALLALDDFAIDQNAYKQVAQALCHQYLRECLQQAHEQYPSQILSKIAIDFSKISESVDFWNILPKESVMPTLSMQALDDALLADFSGIDKALLDKLQVKATISLYKNIDLLPSIIHALHKDKFAYLSFDKSQINFLQSLAKINCTNIKQSGDFNRFMEQVGTRLYVLGQAITDLMKKQEDIDNAITITVANKAKNALNNRLREARVSSFAHKTESFINALDKRALYELRAEYPYFLVDEAQDLSYAQSQLVQKLAPHARLVVLVGDPKQAIYRFRGADVQNYLALKALLLKKGKLFSLTHNFRSNALLVDAVNAFFSVGKLGDGIEFSPAIAHRDLGAPMPLKLLLDENPADAIARHIAVQKDIDYKDIAILCRGYRQIGQVQEKLLAYHIPCYVHKELSLFQSDGFYALYWLLYACYHLDEKALITMLAYLRLPQDDVLNWLSHLQKAHLVRHLGAQAMLKALHWVPFLQQDIYEIVAGAGAGVLHEWQCAMDYVQCFDGNTAKLLWQMAHDMQKEYKVASVAGAGVQIMTIHASKGLEFDTVYVIGLNKRTIQDKKNYYVHYIDNAPRLVFEQGYAEAEKNQMRFEEARLAYVALTRAVRMCVLASEPTPKSGAVLRDYLAIAKMDNYNDIDKNTFCLPMDKSGGKGANNYVLPCHLQNKMQWIDSPNAIPKHAANKTIVDISASKQAWEQLVCTKFLGEYRTSFTALTRNLLQADDSLDETLLPSNQHNIYANNAINDPVDNTTANDGVLHSNAQHGSTHFYAPIDLPAPIDVYAHDFAKGVQAGSFLHESLEQMLCHRLDDTMALARIRPLWRAYGMGDFETDDNALQLERTAQWLSYVLRTPCLSGAVLYDCAVQCELGFDMRLTGSLGELNDLFAKYNIDLNLAPDAKSYTTLRGEIDVVYQYDGRYYIIDYKSNSLGDYSAQSIMQAMNGAGYWLQALIYQVAMHRYLKMRLPNYRIEQLGMVEYIFLRGGRIGWQIPTELIQALDDILG